MFRNNSKTEQPSREATEGFLRGIIEITDAIPMPQTHDLELPGKEVPSTKPAQTGSDKKT